MDLSKVEISRAPAVGLVGAAVGEGDGPPGKYEATPNTLYIGGLPIEWNTDQVSYADCISSGACGLQQCSFCRCGFGRLPAVYVQYEAVGDLESSPVHGWRMGALCCMSPKRVRMHADIARHATACCAIPALHTFAAPCHASLCLAVLCCVMQCMELLKMYGEVKYFRLMMDRTTGNSRVRHVHGPEARAQPTLAFVVGLVASAGCCELLGFRGTQSLTRHGLVITMHASQRHICKVFCPKLAVWAWC
jgi:hypothetical protein